MLKYLLTTVAIAVIAFSFSVNAQTALDKTSNAIHKGAIAVSKASEEVAAKADDAKKEMAQRKAEIQKRYEEAEKEEAEKKLEAQKQKEAIRAESKKRHEEANSMFQQAKEERKQAR